MRIDLPPIVEPIKPKPFKVSPELKDALLDMTEDEKILFARTHGYEILKKDTPYRPIFIVARKRSDTEMLHEIQKQKKEINQPETNPERHRFEPLFQIYGSGLQNIPPELEKVKNEMQAKFDIYFDRRQSIRNAKEAAIKNLQKKSSKTNKELELKLRNILVADTIGIVGNYKDRVEDDLYESVIMDKPVDRHALLEHQISFDRALQKAFSQLVDDEKILATLGFIFPSEPSPSVANPYR